MHNLMKMVLLYEFGTSKFKEGEAEPEPNQIRLLYNYDTMPLLVTSFYCYGLVTATIIKYISALVATLPRLSLE